MDFDADGEDVSMDGDEDVEDRDDEEDVKAPSLTKEHFEAMAENIVGGTIQFSYEMEL